MKKSEQKAERGGPLNIWVHGDDARQLDRLRLYLAQKGHFASKSEVLRTCLHAASTDSKFLETFVRVQQADARRK